jgi:hypothetical protein
VAGPNSNEPDNESMLNRDVTWRHRLRPGTSRPELEGFPHAERGYTMGSQTARQDLPERLRNQGHLTAPSDHRQKSEFST